MLVSFPEASKGISRSYNPDGFGVIQAGIKHINSTLYGKNIVPKMGCSGKKEKSDNFMFIMDW